MGICFINFSGNSTHRTASCKAVERIQILMIWKPRAFEFKRKLWCHHPRTSRAPMLFANCWVRFQFTLSKIPPTYWCSACAILDGIRSPTVKIWFAQQAKGSGPSLDKLVSRIPVYSYPRNDRARIGEQSNKSGYVEKTSSSLLNHALVNRSKTGLTFTTIEVCTQ